MFNSELLETVKGKRVLITGGTGSLGTAFIRACHGLCEFTTLSRNEAKAETLKARFPDVVTAIGDCRDLELLRTLVPGHQLVLHGAAVKFVPLAETNTIETIGANLQGTIAVARACAEAGVDRAVLVGTDKACGPTMYGCSKRLCEGVWREAAAWRTGTDFTAVRYGNVLCSTGSVVPRFLDQVRQGKPITVTDPGMTRFWLSMPQAIALVLEQLRPQAQNGTIRVPMAPAMSMAGVCEALAPGHPVQVIGIRPGERMHEKMLVAEDAAYTTAGLDHFMIQPQQYRGLHLPHGYEYCSDTCRQMQATEFLKLVQES